MTNTFKNKKKLKLFYKFLISFLLMMIYSGKKIMTVVGIVQGKEYIKSGT